MNRRDLVTTGGLWAVCLTVLMGAGAGQDLTDKPAVQDAVVNFGHPVHPQPPPPDNHVLDPNDVTIVKGGTVTFTMHGMGHGLAIYPVSKNTTRAHIAEDLCQGGFGTTAPDPTVCNVANATAALSYSITDGSGKVVIDIADFPTQRQVDSTPGQLFSAGGLPGVLLTGSTSTTRGNQLRYRFAEDGRYLVICINRVHAINDWMFGFVNVV
jgi:plastocyanin